MEDLIYVLILIAWAVFAFYRQSQKRKAARAEKNEPVRQQPTSAPKERSWEEILFGEEIPEEDETDPEPEQEFPGRKGGTAYEPISLEQKYMNRKIESLEDPKVQERMEKEKTILLEEDENESETGKNDENLLEDFDLRKAVIYSEILNRPYD